MNIEFYAKKHPKNKPGIILPENLDNINKLPVDSKIFDIGCAEGSTIQWLGSRFLDRYKFIGIDLSNTRIQKALKKKIPRAVFCLAKAETLSLVSGRADFVIASQVIEHVSSDIEMLMEIERVLIFGGKFQIDTVYKRKWARYFYRSPSGWALDPTHVREYTDIDDLISKFPSSLKIQSIKLQKTYRKLNIISIFSFLPDWLQIRIPGYFTVFISGYKTP